MKGTEQLQNLLYQFNLEDFKYLKKNSKRINKLFSVEIEDMKFLSYKLNKMIIPECLTEGNILLLLQKVFKEKDVKISLEDINREEPQNVLCFIFWLLDSQEEINQLESEQLQSLPDAEMTNAGIENFNQFGIINTIDALAGGDILKWKKVIKMSYIDVFTKLKKNKVESEYNKSYSKILEQKSKNKR
jgi:hypothetical protein